MPLELDDLASHVTDFALDIYEIALAEDPDMTLVGFKQRLFTTFANDTMATIRSKFYNCRKAKDETFGMLASKLRRIALSWDMAGYADPPGPEMVLQTFLAALITGKHRGMVEAIQDASDTSRWTLLQWITKLESRVHNKGAEVSATHAHETGGSSGKSKKKKGKKAGADSSDKPEDTKEAPKKDGRTCRLCKKVGHIQYNCPDKNKGDKPSNTNFSQMSWLLCSVEGSVNSLPTRDLLIESETRLERALEEQDYRLPSRPHDTGAGKRVWIRAECGPWLVDPGALLSSVVDEKSAAELPGPIYPMAPEDAHVRATTMTGDASPLGWKIVVVRVPGVTHLKGRAKRQKKVSVRLKFPVLVIPGQRGMKVVGYDDLTKFGLHWKLGAKFFLFERADRDVKIAAHEHHDTTASFSCDDAVAFRDEINTVFSTKGNDETDTEMRIKRIRGGMGIAADLPIDREKQVSEILLRFHDTTDVFSPLTTGLRYVQGVPDRKINLRHNYEVRRDALRPYRAHPIVVDTRYVHRRKLVEGGMRSAEFMYSSRIRCVLEREERSRKSAQGKGRPGVTVV